MNSPLNLLLFAVLPYVALVLFFVISVRRYRSVPYGYTSKSSQFLENRRHFWGMVPFHYGIILILLGHLVAFLLPDTVLAWNGTPWRLYLLEFSGYLLGLLTLFGLVTLALRRLGGPPLLALTGKLDWIVFATLFVQVISGLWIAVGHRWGSSWFAASMTPYLRSLFTLQPDVQLIAGFPHIVKVHIVSAFLLIGLFPFTRLVHILVAPLPYFWRRPQVVRWSHKERRVSGSRKA